MSTSTCNTKYNQNLVHKQSTQKYGARYMTEYRKQDIGSKKIQNKLFIEIHDTNKKITIYYVVWTRLTRVGCFNWLAHYKRMRIADKNNVHCTF